MHCIIDADVLRYEIGFGAQTGWKAITGTDDNPPFDYVEKLLNDRIEAIMRVCNANSYTLYLTKGKTFRYDIAKTKPYKGTRVSNKPWHFDNLTAHMSALLPCEVITYLEADDAMAIEAISVAPGHSVICSRDKDLKQVPTTIYSWELGNQPSFGPELVTKEGYLILDRSSKQPKLKGTGLSFFYAQMLMGDNVDNIGGAKKIGPVGAYELLNGKSPDEQLEAVKETYKKIYGDEWETRMTEQGQLTWIIRRLDSQNQPVMYQIGMDE